MINKGVVQTDHMEGLDDVEMDELFQEMEIEEEEEEVYGDEVTTALIYNVVV